MTYKTLFTKHLKELSWFLPFLCFIAGYQILHKVFYNPTTCAPVLLGKTVPQALRILSDHNLNMRMIAEKEDPDIPAGTILVQTPAPKSSVRPQQTIFLVVSKKPTRPLMPDLRNTQPEEYIKILKKMRVRFRCFEIQSNAPEGMCLGQIPTPHTEIPAEGVILYKASRQSANFLMPAFKGKPITEVTLFLKKHNLPVQIHHTHTPSTNHTCQHCCVSEQKPLPGSFISLKNPFTVQLKI